MCMSVTSLNAEPSKTRTILHWLRTDRNDVGHIKIHSVVLVEYHHMVIALAHVLIRKISCSIDLLMCR